MRTRRRAALIWVAIGLGVFVVTYALYLGRPVNREDESWMLWLLHRVAQGDVVYRDAYNVSTPLPAWIGGFAVWMVGPQLAVLRALVAASFALQVVVGLSVARRCGLRWPGCALLAVAMTAFGSPLVAFTSWYSSLATLGALVALRCVLWWYDRRRAGESEVGPLIGTGIACGFAFWCKPNVGGLMLGATAVSILAIAIYDRRALLRALILSGAGFAGFSATVGVAIVATGAWGPFVDQVFVSKRQYLDIGFTYLWALSERIDRVSDNSNTDLRGIVQLGVMATPLLVAAVLVWGCWRHHKTADPRYIVLVAFVCAGLVGVFPRPGVNHFVNTMPLTLTGVVGVWALTPRHERVPARARWLGAAAVCGAVFLGAAVVAGDSVQAYGNAQATHDLAHFRVTPVRKQLVPRMARLRDGLATHTDGAVFIAREDAGFLYFVTGTRDPLPYDMVERSDLGVRGERGVIARIQRGDVEWVCLHPQRQGAKARSPLLPHTLDRWVRSHLEFVEQLPACELYRATAGSETGPRA